MGEHSGPSPVAPALTAEQRRLAAAKAVRARAVRARVRADLAAGATTLDEVLGGDAAPDVPDGSDGSDGGAPGGDEATEAAEAVGAMRVRVLLESLPGVGERRAEAAMVAARIPEGRRVRGLGPRQRAALLAHLASRS